MGHTGELAGEARQRRSCREAETPGVDDEAGRMRRDQAVTVGPGDVTPPGQLSWTDLTGGLSHRPLTLHRVCPQLSHELRFLPQSHFITSSQPGSRQRGWGEKGTSSCSCLLSGGRKAFLGWSLEPTLRRGIAGGVRWPGLAHLVSSHPGDPGPWNSRGLLCTPRRWWEGHMGGHLHEE